MEKVFQELEKDVEVLCERCGKYGLNDCQITAMKETFFHDLLEDAEKRINSYQNDIVKKGLLCRVEGMKDLCNELNLDTKLLVYSLPFWRIESIVQGDCAAVQIHAIIDYVFGLLQAREFELRNYRNYLFAKAEYLYKVIGIEDGMQFDTTATLYHQCESLSIEVSQLSERKASLTRVLRELEDRVTSAIASYGFRYDVFRTLLSLHSCYRARYYFLRSLAASGDSEESFSIEYYRLMKMELQKWFDTPFLSPEVREDIEGEFADPSTFTVEDKPAVEEKVLRYCLQIRDVMEGEVEKIRSSLACFPPECLGGFLEERVTELRRKELGKVAYEEWEEFGKIKNILQQRYMRFQALHELLGNRMLLVACVKNGSEKEYSKLKQVDESILSWLKQLKKTSSEKEVPFLGNLDFVCPTDSSNVFACLLREIAFLVEVYCVCSFSGL